MRRYLTPMLLALVGCQRAPALPASPSAQPPAQAGTEHTPAGPATAELGVRVSERGVQTRSYRVLEPVTARFALRFSRPDGTDPRVVLSVAGTYTSPQGEVEGMVIADGRVRQKRRFAWEGVLRVTDGRAHVERREAATFAVAALSRYAAERSSLLQGHLLVLASQPRPLKPSLALHRRAIGNLHGKAVVVDSLGPVALAQFASDLVALGIERAFNLDMGAWSEGFYRDGSGARVVLGHDHSATQRQSNWLVLERP